MVQDVMELAMWSGWLSLLLMLPLAMTSNNISVRVLRRGWQVLHRLVYPAALLAFLHWVLSAFNPVSGYVHLGVLAVLETIRVGMLWYKHRHARATVVR